MHKLPFILPGSPNGLRSALDAAARQEKVTVSTVSEADSLPLFKLLIAQEQIYTALPLHAVWTEVEEGRPQAARIVDPPLQRSISMAMPKTKGLGNAVQRHAGRPHSDARPVVAVRLRPTRAGAPGISASARSRHPRTRRVRR